MACSFSRLIRKTAKEWCLDTILSNYSGKVDYDTDLLRETPTKREYGITIYGKTMDAWFCEIFSHKGFGTSLSLKDIILSAERL